MFKAELNINGKTIPLGEKALRRIVLSLPDADKYQEIYDDLAKHPCAEIRCNTTAFNSLSTMTFNRLKKDTEVTVLYWILANPKAEQLLFQEDLNRMIALGDFELIEMILLTLDHLPNCDPVETIRRIVISDEPQIYILAADYVNANPEECMDLLADPDPDIRRKLEKCSSLIWPANIAAVKRPGL